MDAIRQALEEMHTLIKELRPGGLADSVDRALAVLDSVPTLLDGRDDHIAALERSMAHLEADLDAARAGVAARDSITAGELKPAHTDLLASTIEANLRTLEAHTRSQSVGASMSVGCEASRTVGKSGLGAPCVRWIVNLHLDTQEPRRLAQGHGRNFDEALLSARTQANAMAVRCPTCGHKHEATAPDQRIAEARCDKAEALVAKQRGDE